MLYRMYWDITIKCLVGGDFSVIMDTDNSPRDDGWERDKIWRDVGRRTAERNGGGIFERHERIIANPRKDGEI